MSLLNCSICGDAFQRPGSRGPIPKFCTPRCKGRRDRQRPGRREYEREYRRAERAAGKRRDYEHEYYRRPEVQERYRLRWRELYGDPHPDVVVAAPYTGHRWLEMARGVAGVPDPEAPWAEDKYDEMGEAVLALLEGRDMEEAVAAYRKQEYVSRHLTVRVEDWGGDEQGERRWFESVMPQAPSAEDEFIATLEVDARYHHGSNRRRFGNNRGQQQPRRRRMRDAGLRSHRRAA